jgi:hypothetical protein
LKIPDQQNLCSNDRAPQQTMSVLVKGGKVQTEQMFSGLHLKAAAKRFASTRHFRRKPGPSHSAPSGRSLAVRLWIGRSGAALARLRVVKPSRSTSGVAVNGGGRYGVHSSNGIGRKATIHMSNHPISIVRATWLATYHKVHAKTGSEDEAIFEADHAHQP